jgi:hypothetical protein
MSDIVDRFMNGMNVNDIAVELDAEAFNNKHDGQQVWDDKICAPVCTHCCEKFDSGIFADDVEEVLRKEVRTLRKRLDQWRDYPHISADLIEATKRLEVYDSIEWHGLHDGNKAGHITPEQYKAIRGDE